MYVRSEPKPPVFNGIIALEGRFTFRPDVDTVPAATVSFAYINSDTKTTYGKCDFHSFSPKTIEALIEFLRCAEQDFGDVVFEGGMVTPFGPLATTSVAESGDGLPKGLGEGR